MLAQAALLQWESVLGRENLITNRVNTKEDIYESIKSFFLKGK